MVQVSVTNPFYGIGAWGSGGKARFFHLPSYQNLFQNEISTLFPQNCW